MSGALRQTLSSSRRVVDLYRRICREIPRACVVYDLDASEQEVRKACRKLFDEHANVMDPRLITIQLEEGEQHLQEVMHQWKQRTHLFRLLRLDPERSLELPEHKAESPFMRAFYAGN